MNNEIKKYRILVVDDEQSVRDEFANVFAAKTKDSTLEELESKLFGSDNTQAEQANYDVVFCSQGDKAVEAVRLANAQGTPFAAMFLDMRMPPGPDGLWTAQEIRKLDEDIHIVIVTAFSDIDPREISQKVQPLEKLLYVQKPFYPQEIRQFAAALTSKWYTEQQLNERNKQLAKVVRQVIDTNKALREADRFKHEFISKISFELMSPLSIFKMVVGNAIDGVYGQINPKFQANLITANNSINDIAKMITEFVDLGQLEMHNAKLTPKQFSVQEMIKSICDSFKAQFSKKEIGVKIHAPETDITVEADKFRIKQAISHLLNNAIKYTPEKGTVVLRVVDINDAVEFAVQDDGPGIEQDDIERVFSRFVQIKREVGPGAHGVGIGLTLAKTIVELHGGKIWAQSSPGQGSTFRFIIPKVAAIKHAAIKDHELEPV